LAAASHSSERPPARPRYLHLLWDEDLEQLRPVLHLLSRRYREVVHLWYERYAVHFGETRTLGEREFGDLYGRDLLQVVENLLRGTIDAFVADLRASGERLVERGVPFGELVAALHLFEDCVSDVLDAEDAGGAPGDAAERKLELLRVLDKLSHCRVVVVADAYFEAVRARATARRHRLEAEAARLAPDPGAREIFHGIVGRSVAMHEIFQRVQAAAASRGTVLIIGESGTGKELVARAVHECGAPAGAPFVAVNCSALPRELIESELFGYRRGAFSGAHTEYVGLFRAAEGGTLFLDEVTEMALDTQSKLLRALQERRIRPVGSIHEVPIDIRIAASTNIDPHQALLDGRLRRDLYYRLNVNTLRLPPLRERPEDVPLLVDYFSELSSARFACPKRPVSPAALAALEAYAWPGNVRELMNAVESAYTFGGRDTIDVGDLPPAVTGTPPADRPPPGEEDAVRPLAEMERRLVVRALAATGGNKLRAARLLGISRKRLYAKLAKYGLPFGR